MYTIESKSENSAYHTAKSAEDSDEDDTLG